jgi:hypothetical protein
MSAALGDRKQGHTGIIDLPRDLASAWSGSACVLMSGFRVLSHVESRTMNCVEDEAGGDEVVLVYERTWRAEER